MKKVELCDSEFDGDIGVLSRRGIINELLSNRHVFETPFQKFIRKTWRYVIIGGIILLAIQSIRVMDHERIWDNAEKSVMSQIYHGSKSDVEANKAKAFQRLEIAGASGEGRRVSK